MVSLPTENPQVDMLTAEKSPINNSSDKREPVDTHYLPANRLFIVFVGLMLTVFLAALDQTIVSTALPSVVNDLGNGHLYSWIGSAYILASTVFIPLYGKLSDLIGRKPVLFSAIVVFLIGSALAGSAQNMIWLIIARAVQGLGGGGILGLVQIVISDIVPLKSRGSYFGFVGMTWAIASVVGYLYHSFPLAKASPVIGGALAQHVSWRWCFFINLPTGGIAITILATFLQYSIAISLLITSLVPVKHSLNEIISTFDFVGLFGLVSGMTLILTGLSQVGSGHHKSWSSSSVLAPLIIGFSLLISAIINEFFTSKSPIFPVKMLRNRTTLASLYIVLVHGIAFIAGAYFLPLYFQAVKGYSPTMSGVVVLPYSLAAISSIPTGRYISKTGDYKWVILCSLLLVTLGLCLLASVDYNAKLFQYEIYQLITALGFGPVFICPLIAMQAVMPVRDIATTTASLVFVRLSSFALGISIGSTVYSSQLSNRLSKIDYHVQDSGFDNIKNLVNIQPVELRDRVLHAYAKSVATIWIVIIPLVFSGALASLLLKKYTLERTVVRLDTRTDNITAAVEEGI